MRETVDAMGCGGSKDDVDAKQVDVVMSPRTEKSAAKRPVADPPEALPPKSSASASAGASAPAAAEPDAGAAAALAVTPEPAAEAPEEAPVRNLEFGTIVERSSGQPVPSPKPVEKPSAYQRHPSRITRALAAKKKKPPKSAEASDEASGGKATSDGSSTDALGKAASTESIEEESSGAAPAAGPAVAPALTPAAAGGE